MDSGPPIDEGIIQRELNDREYYVFQTLLREDKTGHLSRIYYGAAKSIQQIDNPERLVNSAHNCRELMDQLPRYRKDLPFPDRETSLTGKVGELTAAWETLKHEAAYNGDTANWPGKVDKELKAFLRKLEKFFVWQKENRPGRKEQARKVMKRKPGSQLPMPSAVDEPKILLWVQLRSYFDKASHHGISPLLENELAEKRYALEGLILDAMRPDTVPQLHTIDAIIEEGEANGDS